MSKTNLNFTFFENYLGKLAEKLVRTIVQSVFEGHLLLLDWINTRKWYIPLSALSDSEIYV